MELEPSGHRHLDATPKEPDYGMVMQRDQCRAREHDGLPTCTICRIRCIGICAAVDDEALRELEAITSRRHLRARQPLLLEGDPVEYAYAVVAGGLKVYKSLLDGRAQMVGLLLPGDFLGLPPRSRYSFSVETMQSTELCRFARTPLMALFARYEKLQAWALMAAYDELAAAQEHMLLLGRKHAIERLSSLLLSLDRRMPRSVDGDNRLHIPLHRAEIADYLGLAVETVSRAFTQLRSLGVLRMEQASVATIVDRDRLGQIAECGWTQGTAA